MCLYGDQLARDGRGICDRDLAKILSHGLPLIRTQGWVGYVCDDQDVVLLTGIINALWLLPLVRSTQHAF